MTKPFCRKPSTASATGALFALVAIVSLAGCGKSAPPAAADDRVRPAMIQEVGGAAAIEKLRFPGRIRAARRAELSFNVPGFLVEFSLPEGTRIRSGQIVARLDDAVFKSRVSSARAEFERARTDLERYQRLWDSERAVARSEVDDRRSRLEVARTNLAAAEQDLTDTVIRAPFSGILTRRRLEAFSNVQPKQAIADLQDLGALEIVINVPERIVRNSPPRGNGIAVFEGSGTRQIPLRLKSYSAEADPDTQTYEVVLALGETPPGMTLLPGMSATVLPFVGERATNDQPPAIPLSAIATASDGSRFVWVVGDGGAVARRQVEPGEVRAGEVLIGKGLQAGERIVVAGVSGLREGMKVRPLETNAP